MTIEELLQVSVDCIKLAQATAIETDGNATAHISAYAALAQAAAQTAQAMTLYTATSKGTDNDTQVFWLRVDNGN